MTIIKKTLIELENKYNIKYYVIEKSINCLLKKEIDIIIKDKNDMKIVKKVYDYIKTEH
jgi:hypothetical protein